jgi:hypothetical protein
MSLIQRADGQPGTPIARLRRRGETLLRDPLSEVTRKERRTLLGASTLAILWWKAGLFLRSLRAASCALPAASI